jgi:hypothetical protein
MALWRYNDLGWEKTSWAKMTRTSSAVLYGSGESLNSADLEEKGSMRFVQNKAWKQVEPHVWIGMDVPSTFEDELFTSTQFRKVLRGNHTNELVNGVEVKDLDEVYFADLVEKDRGAIWTERGMDTKFCWLGNTMAVSLHIILWMGFKEIIFSGIDLGGKYCDGRDVIPKVKRLMEEEYVFMKWFTEVAKKNGVKLINRSPTSRLKDLMITK